MVSLSGLVLRKESMEMKTLSDVLVKIDDFVWGPVMLVLLVGTGIFLTIRTRALCWRNLPYALKRGREMYLRSPH